MTALTNVNDLIDTIPAAETRERSRPPLLPHRLIRGHELAALETSDVRLGGLVAVRRTHGVGPPPVISGIAASISPRNAASTSPRAAANRSVRRSATASASAIGPR